ncbi:MAG TPA: glutathione S-transferase family protein [Xanthobacteraceae bacterium]
MLTLVIGNKNYSSWSMRPWLAMKVAGIRFEERVVPLFEEGYKARILAASPAGKVPALIDGDVQVWESLAIIEHLAERFPEAGLWPADAAARAQARAISAEMHAGFQALRNECPMNMSRPVIRRELSEEARANVARIDAIWSGARARFGAGGPFLFGRFSGADAMYAPVVSRFLTYAVEVSPAARAYMDAVTALPAFAEWKAAGIAEPWVIPHDEVDWPQVAKA